MKHFFKKSVSASSLLITVATSCKLWIATLADREEYFTQFYLRKFEQEKCWSSGRKYKCYPRAS